LLNPQIKNPALRPGLDSLLLLFLAATAAFLAVSHGIAPALLSLLEITG